MKLFTSLIISFLFVAFCNATSKDQQHWENTIEEIKQELPRRHVHLFFQTTQEDFEKSLDRIKANLPHLTDTEVPLKLQQAIARIGDSHTTINWQQPISQWRNKAFPSRLFHCYYFKDGLYIIGSNERDSVIVGQRLISISGVSIETIEDSLKTLLVAENESISKLKIPDLINRYQILQFFGLTPNINNKYIDIEVVDDKNNTTHHQIELKKDKNYSPYKSNFHLLNGWNYRSYNGWFIDQYKSDIDYYLIQYNKCYSKELAIMRNKDKKTRKDFPSFNEFSDRVIKTLKEEPIEKLVFDMRYNGGGSSRQGTQLINEISQLDNINNQNKIFVVIGRKTFSSAILNTIDFLEKTDATIIGESTAGKASHFGELKHFTPKHSNIDIHYSTKYFYCSGGTTTAYRSKGDWINHLDTIVSIVPEHTIELEFEDFKNGTDPVIEWLLENE